MNIDSRSVYSLNVLSELTYILFRPSLDLGMHIQTIQTFLLNDSGSQGASVAEYIASMVLFISPFLSSIDAEPSLVGMPPAIPVVLQGWQFMSPTLVSYYLHLIANMF